MPEPTVELIYVGAVRRRGELVQMYGPISKDGTTLGARGLLFRRALTDDPPGSRLEVDCNPEDEDEIYTDKPRYLGVWHNAEEVASWRAAHDAVLASEKARGDELPASLKEHLRPVRQAYTGLGDAERAVLIAQVVLHVAGEAG